MQAKKNNFSGESQVEGGWDVAARWTPGGFLMKSWKLNFAQNSTFNINLYRFHEIVKLLKLYKTQLWLAQIKQLSKHVNINVIWSHTEARKFLK